MATTTVQAREHTNLIKAIYTTSFREALATILGSDTAADCFLVEVMNQARNVPKLHQCSTDGIRFHLLRVAQLGLNPALPNEVFFIPREGKSGMELTLQYGYGGLRKLVMRSERGPRLFYQ